MSTTCCVECGGDLGAGRDDRRFCCDACRRAFNHRRAGRGAAVYDLSMTLRYERGVSKSLKVWRALCRLAETWRDEDLAERDGRASWMSAPHVIGARPYLIVERGPTIRQGRR